MTQRLPQRTMDSTRPIPGMVSPRAAIRIPSGPSRTAVPSRTSTTVQPGIVAGLVSGAATRGCRIAIAAAEGPAFAWEAGLADGRAPPGSSADGLGMLPTMAGASDADAVFRVPSILPLDRASEIRGKGVSICATATGSSVLANCGQFRPPAHPSPKLATTATVTSKAVRARSPNGSRTSNTSSRSGFRKFHRLARCSRHWPATTFPDRMLSTVLGSRSCMACPTFRRTDDVPRS
jgi:hypothetical protein